MTGHFTLNGKLHHYRAEGGKWVVTVDRVKVEVTDEIRIAIHNDVDRRKWAESGNVERRKV